MLLVDSKFLGSNLSIHLVVIIIGITLIGTEVLRKWLALLQLADNEGVIVVRDSVYGQNLEDLADLTE